MRDSNIITKFGFKPLLIIFILGCVSCLIGKFEWFFLILLIFAIVFYRNPEREADDSDPRAILAPVDGKIIEITQISKDKISVVINKTPFCVGVLRAPFDLSEIKISKKHGLFLCSFMPISKKLNEQVQISAKSMDKDISMQISAGALSRHIGISYANSLGRTKRFGFIFDGTVSLILPSDSRIIKSVGDSIKATDLLGYLSYGQDNERS